MPNDLNSLVEKSRSVQMTECDKEDQRRSFAYGSAKIENNNITKQMIDEAAQNIVATKE